MNIEKLYQAAWQVLDDMGKNGFSCCLATKAELRVAIESFIKDEEDKKLINDNCISLEDSINILKDLL